jgi:hypothetical protein
LSVIVANLADRFAGLVHRTPDAKALLAADWVTGVGVESD